MHINHAIIVFVQCRVVLFNIPILIYDVAREPVNYIRFIQGCMRMSTRELACISVLIQRS